MNVYNQTMKVDPSIHDAWLQWQMEKNIPEIRLAGNFIDHRFYHLLDQDERDGITYVLQLFTENIDQLKRFLQEYSFQFRQQSVAEWGDLCVVFETIMEDVQ